MNNNKFILRFSFLLLASLLSLITVIAQQDSSTEPDNAISQDEKVEVYSATREELHRYMGYEELLPKYFSLPYDVAMNTNLGGPFLDISYLFLLFLPILILFGIKNKWLKLIMVGLMLLFMIISLPSGYKANNIQIVKVEEIGTALSKELDESPFMAMPLVHLKLQLTKAANAIYLPIHHHVIDVISGEGDSITYPIFFLLFVLIFFILQNRMKETSRLARVIAYFFLMYCFLWLILGAGVIWYGLLMLPLGLIFIGVDALKNRKETNFFKYAFFAFGIIWMINALTYRLGNYPTTLTDEQRALGGTQTEFNKGAVHIGSLTYGLGRTNKAGLIDFLFPGYNDVASEINSQPNALVYRVGTYFQYFISQNNERVLEDNQLAFFDNTYDLVPNKLQLVRVLKDQGYRYLIVDYQVASIDRTPDESLRKKARRLQEFLTKNTSLQIIGTDRVVINSKGQQVYGVAGRKLVSKGTFVAYKIK